MLWPSKKAFFDDFVFDIFENVYDPAEDSYLFAENLDVESGDCVLDMGTGCGILGVLVAEKASEVLAVDVNPYAIRCAKHNAWLNGVGKKSSFIQADLFGSLGEKRKFDCILFNAPYLPSENGETDFWLGRSWAGGDNGRFVIDRFVSEAKSYLKTSGKIFLMQSNLSGLDETICGFARNNLQSRVVATRSLPFFEKIFLIKATLFK